MYPPKATKEEWAALMALDNVSNVLQFRFYGIGKTREETSAFLGPIFNEKMWELYEKACPQEKFKGISSEPPKPQLQRDGPDMDR